MPYGGAFSGMAPPDFPPELNLIISTCKVCGWCQYRAFTTYPMTVFSSISTSTILSVFASHEAGLRSAATYAALALITERGQSTIEEVFTELKISRETAQSVLRALERGGFVVVERGSNGRAGKKRSIYRIKP